FFRRQVAAGYRQVKVLEFFDCSGPRQSVEDLREVELQGAQGDRKAEVFYVSNDDTAVAQRRLEDKQPEEKTNIDCLVKEQEKEYQTGWKTKTGNILVSFNQREEWGRQTFGCCRTQQQNGLVN
nr:zinc finger, CCHC-type [Tanacetum cinerariifolium]